MKIGNLIGADLALKLEGIAQEQTKNDRIQIPSQIITMHRGRLDDTLPRYFKGRQITDLIWHEHMDQETYKRKLASHTRITNEIKRFAVYTDPQISFPMILEGKPPIIRPLRFFSHFREHMLEQYKEHIRDNKHLYEASASMRNYCWWDIDNDIIMGYDRVFMANLSMIFEG